jgi:hypothetical protein
MILITLTLQMAAACSSNRSASIYRATRSHYPEGQHFKSILSKFRSGFSQCLQRNISHSHLNPLNPELNPICHLLALLGAHNILHVSSIGVKLSYSNSLTLGLQFPTTGLPHISFNETTETESSQKNKQ